MIQTQVPILTISDAVTTPSGFGRVHREFVTRLPKDKYRVGALSPGWFGSRRFPGVQGYVCPPNDKWGADSFPAAVVDHCGDEPFILWTLMDVAQMAWLADAENMIATARSTKFVTEHRKQFRWISHFPVDGTGHNANKPPLYFDYFVSHTDYPVFMSQFGYDVTQPWLTGPAKDRARVIKHAVDTTRYYPQDRGSLRAAFDVRYRADMVRHLTTMKAKNPEGLADLMSFQMKDRFIVMAIMANRMRKYWPEVMAAFAALVEHVPNAAFIGVCGDRQGTTDDSWSLMDVCTTLGLRVERAHAHPNVWLIDTVGGSSEEEEDRVLASLINCADHTVLLGGGEGFGLPQLEAHACGLPCTVGAYSASIELAVNSMELVSPRAYYHTGNNVVRRPAYSVADVADKLLYSYKNPAWRGEVGVAGVAQAKAMSWENTMPQWLELLKEVENDLGS